MPKKGALKKGAKHWFIEKIRVSGDPQADRSVEWECSDDPGHPFVVMFPSRKNPLKGLNEVYSVGGVAKAEVKSYDKDVVKGKVFHYCVLMMGAGKEDSAVGPDSPPTMVIE